MHIMSDTASDTSVAREFSRVKWSQLAISAHQQALQTCASSLARPDFHSLTWLPDALQIHAGWQFLLAEVLINRVASLH